MAGTKKLKATKSPRCSKCGKKIKPDERLMSSGAAKYHYYCLRPVQVFGGGLPGLGKRNR